MSGQSSLSVYLMTPYLPPGFCKVCLTAVWLLPIAPVQDSLLFRSASRFTAFGSENLASFRRLPRISTL